MNLWNPTRWAATAPALLIAAALAVLAPAAVAQQPAAPTATPAAPAAPAATPAPAAPAAPAATASGGKQVEIVDNPYGLEALWKGGDLVAKITLGILVFMSIGSWYMIITKLLRADEAASPGEGGQPDVLAAPTPCRPAPPA